MREYFRSYSQTPKQKAYHSAYYKQLYVRERISARNKERSISDVNYAIAVKLRNRINKSLRNGRNRKAAKTEEVLDCTVSEFRQHLQSKFTDGMDWTKFLNGEIVVDHIVPIALFDLSDEAQQKAAFNFRNCQPMWATENLRKSDFITHQGNRIRARHIRNIIPFTNSVAA